MTNNREPITGGETNEDGRGPFSSGELAEGDSSSDYTSILEPGYEPTDGDAEQVLEDVGRMAIENLGDINDVLKGRDGNERKIEIEQELDRIKQQYEKIIEDLENERIAADQAARAVGEMLYDHIQASEEVSEELERQYTELANVFDQLRDFEPERNDYNTGQSPDNRIPDDTSPGNSPIIPTGPNTDPDESSVDSSEPTSNIEYELGLMEKVALVPIKIGDALNYGGDDT